MWGLIWGDRGRGQSNPIALVLVFGLVIASTTIVVVAGGSAIVDTRNQLDVESAENSMTQFDSQVALVALGESGTQRVDFGANTNSGYQVDETAGKITIKNGSGHEFLSKDLGAVTYESDDGTTIAYQGGGVWRSSGEGESVMVSPPEFHYRGTTLTLPLVTINHGEQITDRAVVRRNKTTQHYPNETSGNVNPVDDTQIFVTVQSDYYRAWGQYFEERTDTIVKYDDSNNKVTIELVTEVEQTRATDAVAGLSSGKLDVEGTGAKPCGSSETEDKLYTDSYNSSKSTDYCTQLSNDNTQQNGNVSFGGDVDYNGDANFYGDIRSGGFVNISGGTNIRGDIYWTVGFTETGMGNDYDSKKQISGVRTQPPVNRIVASNAKRISADNDNGNAGIPITGTPPAVDYSSSTAEIDEEGEYYLEKLEVSSGNTLTLDTSDGDIAIAVDEYVDISGTLKIDGDNDVRIYVRDMNNNGDTVEYGTGPDKEDRNTGLKVHDGQVKTTDQNSTQLRVYGNDTLNTSVSSGKFTGVIWAPSGSDGSGGFRIDHADLYGAIITGDVFIEAQGRIHYDEALRNEEIISPDSSVAKITYLHVSTNEINITSK